MDRIDGTVVVTPVTPDHWTMRLREAINRGDGWIGDVTIVADEHDPHDFRFEWDGGEVRVRIT